MLIEQFADHSATRRYEALVWGVPDAPHGIIDGPIGRDRGDPLKMAVVANGRYARTDYRVIGSYSAPAVVSRLECRLETGRTHQIRVHLASIGHPLVGDPTYSQRRPMLGLTRPFLHAAELAFVHPATGERVTFHSPLAPTSSPGWTPPRPESDQREVSVGAWHRCTTGQVGVSSSTGIDLNVGVPASPTLCRGTSTLVSG